MYDAVIFAATYLLPTLIIVALGFLVYRVYLFIEPKIYYWRLSRHRRDAPPKDPAPPR